MNRHEKQTDNPVRGAAAVELAVVLPLLLTLVFGIIEFGWVFMVRETLVNSSREGARVAVLQGSTEQDIRDQVSASMNPTVPTRFRSAVRRREIPTKRSRC